ncbi:MAG: plasmid pRiA4b ORF-3 family protein [Mariniphaga sp.]
MYKVSEQDISNTVNDFMFFCCYLEQRKPKLSDRKAVLGKNDLFALNKMLINKKEVTAPNYMQESYPVIDLMFNLAALGKLYQKTGDDKGKVFLTCTERKIEFDNLNLFEKYAFLLETFWTLFDFKEIGFDGINGIEEIVAGLKKSTPGKELYKGAFSKRIDFDLAFSYNSVLIHYFGYLGFCSFTLLPQKGKTADRYLDSIKAIIPTNLGINLCNLLNELKIEVWNKPYYDEYGSLISNALKDLLNDPDIKVEGIEDYEEDAGEVEDDVQIDKEEPIPFYKLFLPFFPENSLNGTVISDINKAVKGNFIFKVSLEKTVWRMISISNAHSLDDLHLAIQDAFDFDNDHLYSFFMDGKRYSRDRYESPNCEDGPFADEAIIGEIGLYTGQKILYLFDYGDSWEFDVQLLKINEEEEPLKEPQIIDSKGEAPEQYPYWEDYDDEDEDLEEDEEVEENE